MPAVDQPGCCRSGLVVPHVLEFDDDHLIAVVRAKDVHEAGVVSGWVVIVLDLLSIIEATNYRLSLYLERGDDAEISCSPHPF